MLARYYANADADQGLLVIETGNPVKHELASKQKTTSRNKKKGKKLEILTSRS